MDRMIPFLCLLVLAVLLQPALCLYNCSSVYNRNPSTFKRLFVFSKSYQTGDFSNIKLQLLNVEVNRFLKELFFFPLIFVDDSDLSVFCTTDMIIVEVNLCTAQWAGFKASELALNGNRHNIACLGSVDATTDPPIIRFQIPVNSSQDNSCRQSLKVRVGIYWGNKRETCKS